MNLIVVKQSQFIDDQVVELDDRQATHVREVLNSKVGDTLRLGKYSGAIGTGILIESGNAVRLRFSGVEAPPRPLDIEIVLALPRPKVLKRLIESITAIGIKKITFLNSARVEKFYWDSDLLLQSSWESAILKGLEQSRDTIPPVIKFERLFKPFMEDVFSKRLGLNVDAINFAHPYSKPYVEAGSHKPQILFIGPEGGWVDFEVQMFESLGMSGVSFGLRPLKTELFIPFVLGKLS